MSAPDILCDVIDNALLHLYLTVSETTRFTPIPKRNELLVRYLKPLIKDKAYCSAKKELRRLMTIAVTPGANLEATLVELNQLGVRYDKNASDAKQLFDVLGQIEDRLGLPTRFLNFLKDEQPKPDTIYMLQEHVENGFIESGEQVAPVSLFLESPKLSEVLKFIRAGGVFVAELVQMNEEARQGHIVLHPQSKEG